MTPQSKSVLEETKDPGFKKPQTSQRKNDALPFDKKLKKDDILWAQDKPLSKGSSIAEDFATYESSLAKRPKKPIIDPKLLLKRPTYVSKSKG